MLQNLPDAPMWSAAPCALAARFLMTAVMLIGAASSPVLSQGATPRASAPPAAVAQVLWDTTGGPNLPFRDPFQLAIDPDGHLWVADGRNSRFQIFAPDGTFLEVWGTPGSGDGEFNFIDLLGNSSGAVTFDSVGNLFVADSGNHRIQKFDANRQFVTAWGHGGTDDGEFQWTLGVASGPDGRIYVSDNGRRDIQAFDADGVFLMKFGGDGTGEEPTLETYGGIVVDHDGTLLVANIDDRVQRFAPDGTLVAEWGSAGFREGQFSTPYDVAVDGRGRVYVTDHNNHRVQVFAADGTFLATWGRHGAIPLGSPQPGEFNSPVGVAVDGDGNVYVGEFGNDRVQAFRLIGPLAPAISTP
jgi:tripartite motif-containing protein 71